jgi:hypothetical protein
LIVEAFPAFEQAVAVPFFEVLVAFPSFEGVVVSLFAVGPVAFPFSEVVGVPFSGELVASPSFGAPFSGEPAASPSLGEIVADLPFALPALPVSAGVQNVVLSCSQYSVVVREVWPAVLRGSFQEIRQVFLPGGLVVAFVASLHFLFVLRYAVACYSDYRFSVAHV